MPQFDWIKDEVLKENTSTDKILNFLNRKTGIPKPVLDVLSDVAIEAITARLGGPKRLPKGKTFATRQSMGAGKPNKLAPTRSVPKGQRGQIGTQGSQNFNRPSSGDPLSRARTTKTPKSVDTNPKGLVQSPKAPKTDLPRGAAPGNRQDLARRAEQRISTSGGSAKLNDGFIGPELKGNIYADAYGPAVKKFGAHPKDVADQRAFVDADGPIPVDPGTRGRPSATNSSPALRQLREGKRKSTGLQAVKDRLNQGRSSNPPKQSTAPRSVSAEQSLKNTKTLEDQLKRNADNAVRDRLGFDTRRGSSVPEEAVDFSRRRRGLPSEPSRQPVRRDRRGRIIKDKRPESTGPVQGRSVGRKGRPNVTIEERRSGSKPYTPARTSRSPDSGRSTVKGPDNSSVGRSFDNSGELRGLTTKGKNQSGRSPQQVRQTRATLKARIEHLRGLPWSADRSRRIQRMQALLKKMR